jgi:hypothetical protein
VARVGWIERVAERRGLVGGRIRHTSAYTLHPLGTRSLFMLDIIPLSKHACLSDSLNARALLRRRAAMAEANETAYRDLHDRDVEPGR